MWYRVTLDGVPVGAADLVGAPRAIGTMVPALTFNLQSAQAGAEPGHCVPPAQLAARRAV